ncbi:MAG: PorV/PorQ family protein [Candidatus Firestonebacteria bacterium]
MLNRIFTYILVITAAVIIAADRGHASFSSGAAGTAGAQFLKIGVGARPAGMGEAFSALADDSTAMFWNPGALAVIPGISIDMMHAIYFQDMSFDWVSVSMPASFGTIGVNAKYISYGSMMQYDALGAETGSISPYDISAGLTYAVSLNGLNLGAGIKFVSMNIGVAASALVFDAGLLQTFELAPSFMLKAALVAQNIGAASKFLSAEFDMPLNLKAGLAVLFQRDFTLAAEAGFPKDGAVNFSAGGEYITDMGAGSSFILRAGYSTRGVGGLSFGGGLNIGAIRLDYAYVPSGDLGTTQKMSLGLLFRDEESLPAKQQRKRTIKTEKEVPLEEQK